MELLKAGEAKKLAEKNMLLAPAEVLFPIYKKIYEAAMSGQFSIKHTFPEDVPHHDKALAIRKLTQDGYRVVCVRESEERLISW